MFWPSDPVNKFLGTERDGLGAGFFAPRLRVSKRNFVLAGLFIGVLLSSCALKAALFPKRSQPEKAERLPKSRPAQNWKLSALKVDAQLGRAQDRAPSKLLSLLQAELRRQWQDLKRVQEPEPGLYFLAYDVVDEQRFILSAERGAIVQNHRSRRRTLDVDLRVGDHSFDNGHIGVGNYGENGLGLGRPISLDDDESSLRQALWEASEAQYRDALDAYHNAQQDEQLRTRDQQEIHPDFSREKVLRRSYSVKPFDLDGLEAKWKPALSKLSTQLAKLHPRAQVQASLQAQHLKSHLVTSEGSAIERGHGRLRLLLMVSLLSDDGMELSRTRSFDVFRPDELPSPQKLRSEVQTILSQTQALMKAPIAEPYSGPAILEGRAAAVFFHEIFGHRLEGHRQKDDSEGQTFATRIGERVLPEFIDVVDDPRLALLNQVPLNGHYLVDDEGVLAKRTPLVRRGVLRNFLLSRSPVKPFRQSNGHGRRQPGYPVVARQGNLMVLSRRALGAQDLREALIEEIRRQKKPYGLRFVDIDGGLTTTLRSGPQAFKVTPRLVYRVYSDGRPDELVRGADIVGTPLSAFETILATGDRLEVFNGYCGAESGWVSVSAVSPALLLRQIEIERRVHERRRPPLLGPPPL